MKVLIILSVCFVALTCSRRIVITRYIDENGENIEPDEETESQTVPKKEIATTSQKPVKRTSTTLSIDSDENLGFIPRAFKEAGRVAAGAANGAGRIAEGAIEVPAAIGAGIAGGAARATAGAFETAGNAASNVASGVENGARRFFRGMFGKK